MTIDQREFDNHAHNCRMRAAALHERADKLNEVIRGLSSLVNEKSDEKIDVYTYGAGHRHQKQEPQSGTLKEHLGALYRSLVAIKEDVERINNRPTLDTLSEQTLKTVTAYGAGVQNVYSLVESLRNEIKELRRELDAHKAKSVPRGTLPNFEQSGTSKDFEQMMREMEELKRTYRYCVHGCQGTPCPHQMGR